MSTSNLFCIHQSYDLVKINLQKLFCKKIVFENVQYRYSTCRLRSKNLDSFLKRISYQYFFLSKQFKFATVRRRLTGTGISYKICKKKRKGGKNPIKWAE